MSIPRLAKICSGSINATHNNVPGMNNNPGEKTGNEQCNDGQQADPFHVAHRAQK